MATTLTGRAVIKVLRGTSSPHPQSTCHREVALQTMQQQNAVRLGMRAPRARWNIPEVLLGQHVPEGRPLPPGRAQAVCPGGGGPCAPAPVSPLPACHLAGTSGSLEERVEGVGSLGSGVRKADQRRNQGKSSE